ncbi:SH3 domain-containing protein [Flavobacteriaceae bacterium]|jgi:hypothetical protein|nr:SH3 domain-containing protein [Flavobacteriaceae bacterium]
MKNIYLICFITTSLVNFNPSENQCASKCSVDGLCLRETGRVKYSRNGMLDLYVCPSGHEYWMSESKSENPNCNITCEYDSNCLESRGRQKYFRSGMHTLHECISGHQFWVKNTQSTSRNPQSSRSNSQFAEVSSYSAYLTEKPNMYSGMKSIKYGTIVKVLSKPDYSGYVRVVTENGRKGYILKSNLSYE